MVQMALHTVMHAAAITPVVLPIAVEQGAQMDLQQMVSAFKLALAVVGTNPVQIHWDKKLPD